MNSEDLCLTGVKPLMNKTIIKLMFLLHPWGNWDSKLFGKKATLTSTVRMLRWTLSSAPPPFQILRRHPFGARGGRWKSVCQRKSFIYYVKLCNGLQNITTLDMIKFSMINSLIVHSIKWHVHPIPVLLRKQESESSRCPIDVAWKVGDGNFLQTESTYDAIHGVRRQ